MATAYRPGTLVTSRADPPPRGLASNSGTFFVVGAAQKGPTTYAKFIRSMSEFTTHFGIRQAYSILWDTLETFFREGGQQACVARVSGASGAIATRVLADASAGNSLSVSAKNAGLWGNGLSVAVTQPVTGYFQITVTDSTGQRDQSPLCATQSDAISWSRNSDWVNVAFPTSSPSTLIPAVASATALSGGLDDIAGITDAQRVAALALFTSDLGSGQVSIPGTNVTGNRTALIAHAAAFNRQALLDDSDSPSRSEVVSEGQSLQAPGNEYGALFAPWVVIPGLIPGTTRTVPPCALVAGLMARSDAQNSVNVPALGNNGIARFAIDVSQPAWSDSDRDQLNSAGVNVIRTIAGVGVDLYGYRTLANPAMDPSWIGLGNQRLRELITVQATRIANDFVGAQLDGKGRTIAQFAGRLSDMLVQHYKRGSLYGNTPDQAFRVIADTTINTPTTLANNELHAVLDLRMSPFAEFVAIEIVKVAVSQNL